MPTAPAILPYRGTVRICARCLASLYATFANSFPSVVGDAGWPCVRDIMGVSASSVALPTMTSMISSMNGRTTSTPERSMRAWERLLMSSEVHAKCVNSMMDLSSGCWTSLSLMTYSTALTSWLVVRSTFLTSAASAGEKSARNFSRKALASSESGGTSVICGMEASFWSHRTSTITRARTRAYSEKHARRILILAP